MSRQTTEGIQALQVVIRMCRIQRSVKGRWSFQSEHSSLSFLDLCVYSLYQIWRNFYHHFKYFFVPSLISSGTPVTRMCEIVSQVTEALFIFPQPFCSCLPTCLSKPSLKILAFIKHPPKIPSVK